MPLLVLLFIVVPLAELYVIIQVGQAIGVLPTIGILLADSLLGSALLRSQGRLAWRRFAETLQAGRPPAGEIIDGGLIILGGALLLTPGFLTDVLGLALLLPPTRAAIRGLLARRIAGRMAASLRRASAPRPYDVEGSARDVGRRPVPDPDSRAVPDPTRDLGR